MRNDLRTYVIVNLDAIVHNVREIKKCVAPGVKIMAVVKTDGYGHGAVEVGKCLKEEVDCFAVAAVREAIGLRKAGIQNPILILGYTMKARYPELVDFDVTQTIYNLEDARLLGQIALEKGKVAKIHIAVDTGMGRIGFLPNEESADIVKQISELPGIHLEGLFTHFATADETDKSYTIFQMKQYDMFVNMLEERGIHIEVKHACNSAGIMDFDRYREDMVRAGIILYGLYPSDEVQKENLQLEPAMEWKAHVVHVKTAGPGMGISYGKTFITTEKETRIATINAGYGDGYPRALSNKGRVLIHGKSVPIIGRVCMDQFMVDISELDDVKIEDEVTLVGRDGDEFISVEEVAEASGTFNYEFICDIGKRVDRVYKASWLPEI